MKRKSRLRPVGLGRNWKKALDELCRRVVLARDKHCQWCGSGARLQWCHIRSRRYLSTRWNTANSIILCSGCHLRWHHQPLAAIDWFRGTYPVRADQLERFDLGLTVGKIDREAIRLELENAIKEFGG